MPNLNKDPNHSSPAKRSLSRQQNRRKKTSHKTIRADLQSQEMLSKRPNTSYLLQSVAERMPWPQQPRGREPIDPMTPVKAFTMRDEHVSPFRDTYKDVRSSLDKLPEESEYEISGYYEPLNEIKENEEENYETNQKEDLAEGAELVLQDEKRQTANSFVKPKGLKKQATLLDIITLLQNQPNDTGQYFYLISNLENGPYDLTPLLELEDHKKLESYTQFYTLSKKGIVTYLNDEPVEFITLNDWLADKANYNKIRKKTFFKKFDRWKVLRMWRRKICIQKREKVREILEDKLFILHPHFSNVIFKLRKS
jgi:hypothetical protein